MKSSLFFFPARILCLWFTLFSSRPIRADDPLININYTLHSQQPTQKSIWRIFNFSVSYDSIFSLFSTNSYYSLYNLNKMAAEAMASQATHKVEDYFSKTAWPAVKQGSRELIAEMSSEVIKQVQYTVEKIFFAGAGLALVATGGQLIRQNLVNPKKKRKLALLAIGTGMILGGIAAILFCDKLANQLTPIAS